MSNSKTKRNKKLMELKAKGYSINQLSREFVISPTRVIQIIEREEAKQENHE